MIISKRAIPRRTMLRGMGAMLALPLLDSMVPALSALQKTAGKPVNRFGVYYVPNGMIMKNYLPTAVGANYELTPTLSALAPFRSDILVVSGLNSLPTRERPGGAHAKASTRFLTNVSPPTSETWLDVADGRQIFSQFHAIRHGERALQLRDLRSNRIEHALLLSHPREPHFRIRRLGVAKQTLEHNAGIVLCRQRSVGALPHNRAGVRARVACIAGTRRLARLH